MSILERYPSRFEVRRYAMRDFGSIDGLGTDLRKDLAINETRSSATLKVASLGTILVLLSMVSISRETVFEFLSLATSARYTGMPTMEPLFMPDAPEHPSMPPTYFPTYFPTTATHNPTPRPTPRPTLHPVHHPTLAPTHNTDWANAGANAGKGEQPMVALDFETSNAQYPTPTSMAYLPNWPYMMEPFREVTLTPKHGVESDAEYRWTVMIATSKTNDAFGDDDFSEVIVRDHASANYSFTPTKAGKFYNIKLVERSSDVGIDGRETARETKRIAEGAVICKYVRRELRKLTLEDRTLYFDALQKIYSLELWEGQTSYGENFRNGAYFTKKHLAAMSIEGCTPWHTGTVFLTAHSAMTREFEMALQSIHPSLAAPYWEYTLDSKLYGDAWTRFSPVFSDDFFGVFPVEAPFTVSTGGVPDVPLTTESWDSPEHSPWGYLMDNFASDETAYVTRAASMCGLPTTAPLPTCAKLRLMADQTSSSAFRSFVETYYHAEIHPLVGGAWDCKFGEAKTLIDQFPSLAPYVEDILTDLGVLMRYAYSVQKNFSNGVLIPGMAGWSKQWGDVRCPQDCSSPHSGSQPNVTSAIDIDDNAPTSLEDDDSSRRRLKKSDDDDDDDDDANDVFFDDSPSSSHDPDICTCTIDRVRIPLEEGKEMTIEFAFHTLADIELLDKLAAATGTAAASITNYDDDWPREYGDTVSGWGNYTEYETVKLFKGLGQRDTAELVMWFVKLMAYFPKVGPMTAILGSPADPIFWAAHESWERMWHYLRLVNRNSPLGHNATDFWSTWRQEYMNNPGVTCSWSSQAYSMLPFWNLMDYETTWDIERNYWGSYHASEYQYYTNADLNRMFSPTNPELPFLYDEFAWNHCDEWDSNGASTKNTANNVTKNLGVDDDDNTVPTRSEMDDRTNDDDAGLGKSSGPPALDDSDDDDDDDVATILPDALSPSRKLQRDHAHRHGMGGFVGEVNNSTLGFREHFRANLRKSLYEHLGKQYHETKRHAEKLHTNMDGTGQLDQLRQWLYQDPNIHEKVDFSDGTYKQTKIGVEGLKGGLVGAEARTLPEI